MRKANQVITVILFSFLLLLSFNNCSAGGQSAQQQSTTAAVPSVNCDEAQVADSLRTPNSIGEAINLINALPKPLTVDCFLRSLKKPLKVMAVNNTFSAQPAVGNDSPRIFILNTSYQSALRLPVPADILLK